MLPLFCVSATSRQPSDECDFLREENSRLNMELRDALVEIEKLKPINQKPASDLLTPVIVINKAQSAKSVPDQSNQVQVNLRLHTTRRCGNMIVATYLCHTRCRFSLNGRIKQ